MSRFFSLLYILWIPVLLSCSDSTGPSSISTPPNSYYPELPSTDKAVYSPFETVHFSIEASLPAGTQIKYWSEGTLVDSHAASGSSWDWQIPEGYSSFLCELSVTENGIDKTLGTVGIDATGESMDYPRFGFLSKFSAQDYSPGVIEKLTRYHIKGIQFYDWHFKHHDPLAGTTGAPAREWQDISGRTNSLSTVQNYITRAHERGMKAYFYNLMYGATSTAEADGVSPEWFLYRDQTALTPDRHDLPEPPFTSDIWVVNPGLTGWQDYLLEKTAEVYEVLDFDGFHMDQLGDRGVVYDSDGNRVNPEDFFGTLINRFASRFPEKKNSFNLVNQYGLKTAGSAPTPFLYTEVWAPNDTYSSLLSILAGNQTTYGRKTVLAAYMNYKKADSPGTFNVPSVLLTDSFIFAAGGFHLELGEHMLGKEYFPNSNLAMPQDLEKKLIAWYDFQVAYQELLVTSSGFSAVPISLNQGAIPVQNWPYQSNRVVALSKQTGNKTVISLINLSGISSLDWRDTNGTKAWPTTFQSVQVAVPGTYSKIWIASPDYRSGAPVFPEITVENKESHFTLPQLGIWTLITLEN